MIAQLTKNERQLSLLIVLTLAVCGSAMAVAGGGDPLGVHGAIVMLAGILGAFGVISGYYDPEPGEDRLDRYFDDPSRMGIVLASCFRSKFTILLNSTERLRLRRRPAWMTSTWYRLGTRWPMRSAS